MLIGSPRKPVEIAGLLENARAEMRRLIIDLESVGATIRLFSPNIDLEEIRPKPLHPRHAAYKGEVARIVLGALRTAHYLITAEELAAHVTAERDLNRSDTRQRKTVRSVFMPARGTIGATVRFCRRQGPEIEC